ncbi:MAG: peptidase MA domain-containing protein [Oscillochloris sp.]|nr:peptidase MA domain-containing protein [Oscillochloris sp.]
MSTVVGVKSPAATRMATLRALLLLAILPLLIAPAPAGAQDAIRITNRDPFIVFPDRISFNAQVVSSSPISEIVLEYGVDKRTCGDVTARAFPDFTPGTTVDVHWTWEMLNTGSEPPGATIWYRWRATDKAGNTTISEDQRVVWIDTSYGWKQISRNDLTLHWYSGNASFGEDLLNTAIEGVARLAKLTGVRPQAPIDLYIYGTTEQMQNAILYEPSWTGGVAFPANNIIIIGISPEYLEWGKRTIVHELTHLIVGQITFSCGENVPTWLDEGIAVYAEGELDPRSQSAFNLAVAANQLLSVRAISNGFSQHPDLADLSYSQSFSMVSYLVQTYGSAKLLALLGNLRDGMTVEAGVQATYGFDLIGLEDRWRAWLHAAPRSQALPTATPLPSAIPTMPIMAVVPTGPAIPPTPTSEPTLTPTATLALVGAAEPVAPQPTATVAPQRNITLPLIGTSLTFLIGLALASLAAWKLLR